MKHGIKMVVAASAVAVGLTGVLVPQAQAQDPTGSTGYCGTLPILVGVIGDVAAGMGRGMTKGMRLLLGFDPLDPNDPGVQEIPVYAHAPEMVAGYLMTVPQMDQATKEQLFRQYC